MAWSTPLGDDLDGVWEKLCSGRTGVAPVPSPHQVRTTSAAVVPSVRYGADPGERLAAITARTLLAAFADAGLAPGDPRVMLVLGTSFAAYLDTPDGAPLHRWAADAARAIGHPNVPLCVTTACSAGSDSLMVAAALIRGGRCDVCVAGGADVLTEAKRLGHSALGTMSGTGLRAFDISHDGMVLGEGAAFMVLESRESARARGAPVHAGLYGAGSSNDASGLTAPDPSGRSVVAAVERCLSGSGHGREDIGVVSAHGTGTPLNDDAEAAGLSALFRGADPAPTVFGTKGALGHSLGATGAIEAVSTVLALRHKRVPPLAGVRSPLPGLALPPALGASRQIRGGAGLSLTLGFGGFNTCLLFADAAGSR